MGRPVLVGVGNRLRGDDAIGCAVIDELGELEGVKVIDAGNTPENYLEPIARLEPERILIVDACDFGGRPGEFRLFGRDEIERLSYGLLSTHTLPLSLTAEMLARETGADIRLLGVQPARVEFGQDLSVPVAKALPEVVAFVRAWAGA